MKKLLLLSIGFLLSFHAQSQGVNETLFKDMNVKYVRLIETGRALDNQVNIQLDFGQKNKRLDLRDRQIVNKYGAPKTFNSIMDALNYMVENGFEFVSAYSVATTEQVSHHYLLKKVE